MARALEAHLPENERGTAHCPTVPCMRRHRHHRYTAGSRPAFPAQARFLFLMLRLAHLRNKQLLGDITCELCAEEDE